MMKTNKILVNVSDLNDIEKLKKLGISNFLFPVKGFSIGYNSFDVSDLENIEGNIYLLVNRILTDDDIDNFLKIKIPTNVKGFIIEDTGLYEELKDTKYELINFQNHLNNNYKTVNFWLKYFSSIVLSTDITSEEIIEIVNKSSKPVVLYTLGYPMIMYSRRTLVSNFQDYMNHSKKDTISASIPNNITLNFKENAYGTAVFPDKILDARSIIQYLPDDKIKFYLIDSNYIDYNTLKKAITGAEIDNSTRGFLEKKTVYRIGDLP